MHRQRRLATLFVVLALTGCAQATAGQPGAPYAPYSLENMHDRGGDGDGVPFAALAKRQGVSPSYFTRLFRLSYLAPDITEAILDGRQPRALTADKLLAHSRLPLRWHEQRTVLGFA